MASEVYSGQLIFMSNLPWGQVSSGQKIKVTPLHGIVL
jgi:hypothetical protein